jgi:hypothetical protein
MVLGVAFDRNPRGLTQALDAQRTPSEIHGLRCTPHPPPSDGGGSEAFKAPSPVGRTPPHLKLPPVGPLPHRLVLPLTSPRSPPHPPPRPPSPSHPAPRAHPGPRLARHLSSHPASTPAPHDGWQDQVCFRQLLFPLFPNSKRKHCPNAK